MTVRPADAAWLQQRRREWGCFTSEIIQALITQQKMMERLPDGEAHRERLKTLAKRARQVPTLPLEKPK